ncbi:hypothetical protein LTR08_006562 [Meristemomyces frigidus]|nr:hypothetical protein LTR08_006562 [Meristemomyces frigidus]
MAEQQEAEDLWLFGYGYVPFPQYLQHHQTPQVTKHQLPNMETATPLRYASPSKPPEANPNEKIPLADSESRIAAQTSAYPATSKATFAAFGSEDHRGTPSAPGRVATLIDRTLWETLTDQHASAPPRVWGAAYRIPALHVAEVKAYLDIREINGYSIQYTPFHPSSSSAPGKPVEMIQCLLYIGLPSNPQFLGPQDPQALAEHIARSRGPSGENREYLYLLEQALGQLGEGSGDAHVSDLARRCRGVEALG